LCNSIKRKDLVGRSIGIREGREEERKRRRKKTNGD
jgi:hypothetical protein